jgi:chromosomal replication initiator protein
MSDPRNFLSPQQEIDTKNTVSDSVVAGEPIETVSSIWGRVSAAMKQDLGDTKWQAWIKNLTPVTLSEKSLVIQAGNSFIRDRVQSQYAEKLRFMLKREYGAVQQVSVTVGSAHPAQMQSASVKLAPDYPPRLSQMPETDAPASQNAADMVGGLDSRFTFDRFIVGKPNELAFAAARRVAETTTAAFNPLFLYGGVGLGKTHLMHAIAWEINARHPHRRVMYLSAEKFMYRFIRALRYRDMMSFKEQFRSVDVLMIDDVQFISGKDSTQEEFFHTFNALVEDGRQVILSADKSPTDLSGMEERLRSRLGWGMVADIHPANYELRLGILQSRRERCDVLVPDKVLEFLANRITSNIREIEGAFNRLVAQATLVGRDITVEMAHEVLSDLLRSNNRRVTVEDIQKQVASYYNIRTADMFSARRSRTVARPRQIAMYLSKDLTTFSYPEIGRRFGGRDHTTIMHAVRKVGELLRDDAEIADDISTLKVNLVDN